jgi:MFS family permease
MLWRYVVARFLLTASAVLDPFLFLFVVTRLGMPISSIGQCAIAGVLGWVISSPIWIWMRTRTGPKALLQGASVLRLIAPIVTLLLPSLSSLQAGIGVSSAQETSRYAILMAFASIGASLAAQALANPEFLARLGGPFRSGSVSGVVQGAVVLASFAPVLGGVVIQRYGYEALFAVTIIIGLGAVFASGMLVEVPGRRPQSTRDNPASHPEFPGLPAPRA